MIPGNRPVRATARGGFRFGDMLARMAHSLGNLLVVMLGGALGAGARWLLGGWSQRAFDARIPGGHFPVGTLLVNVLGCVAIGALAAWFTTTPHGTDAERVGRFALPLTERTHLLLFVGLLGGFTTFSSFAMDALALMETGQRGRAAAYVLLSNALGLAGAWGAYLAVERLARA